MRRHTLILVLMGLCAGAWAALAPATSDAFNGMEAPDFSVTALDGRPTGLKAHHGRHLVLIFFASWCPPCRAELKTVLELRPKYASKGLAWMGLAADSLLDPDTPPGQQEKDVRVLVENLKIPFPVAIASPALAGAYHFKGIPTCIFIDGTGRIRKVFYGLHDASAFAAALDPLFPKGKQEASP